MPDRAESEAPARRRPATSEEGRFRVLIAGGGVAALEGLLALRELAGDRVQIALLAPEDEFRLRPLSVGEPFHRTMARAFSLWEITREQGAEFHRTALVAIEPDRHVVRTAAGAELPYDALLIATGARPVEAVVGAVTFRGSGDASRVRELVEEVAEARIASLAFAVPNESWWPLAAYELALLASAHLEERGREGAELHLVTPESRPLGIFGSRASAAVGELLDEARVRLHPRRVPVRFQEGALEFKDGAPLPCDRVVALPLALVPEIPGLPHGHRGLVPTDRYGKVDGLSRVFAAGDATWFPIKQGGLAAQQADCAASAIAALAGAPVSPQPFKPVLRGALMTGWGPRYMRSASLGEGESTAARSVLWWPPSKVAGRLLAPYLAAHSGFGVAGPEALEDLEPPVGERLADVSAEHADAVGMALTSAEIDAGAHEYRRALRWLEVVEDLELALPPLYEVKRAAWSELAARE